MVPIRQPGVYQSGVDIAGFDWQTFIWKAVVHHHLCTSRSRVGQAEAVIFVGPPKFTSPTEVHMSFHVQNELLGFVRKSCSPDPVVGHQFPHENHSHLGAFVYPMSRPHFW